MCLVTHPSAARPTSIRVFLADGTPEGFRFVEKSNWTGLGLVSARSDYPQARKRGEWSRPGVYLLTGPPTDDGLRDRLYVGEADDVRDRVDNHVKNKDFWTAVVAFTSKDDNLNKAHVRYLEARLLQLAAAADRVTLDNVTAPPLPRVSEPDQADMEGYLADMLLILPLLGVVAFEHVHHGAAPAGVLNLHGKDAHATGSDTAEGFVVFQDSVARKESVPSMHAYLNVLREHLLDEGVLEPCDAGYRFTKPWLFDSPFTAAGVVLGRSANGRTEWKDKTGRTLKERQEAALD